MPKQITSFDTAMVPQFREEGQGRDASEFVRSATSPSTMQKSAFISLVLTGLVVMSAAVYLLSFAPAVSLGARQVLPLHKVLAFYDRLPIQFRKQYMEIWAKFDGRVQVDVYPYMFDNWWPRTTADVDRAIAILNEKTGLR